ncbi:polysaccharide deacetylase family protein, partial [Streptomyces sp. MS191]|uniref:polysaccharide deacetylase family protein n=1 Tax=Streptomyces sp. ms191 TaxID=1827978 RepID=UPI003966EF8B
MPRSLIIAVNSGSFSAPSSTVMKTIFSFVGISLTTGTGAPGARRIGFVLGGAGGAGSGRRPHLRYAAIRDDYRYFAPLAALGNGVANHTLTHPNLRTLGREAQRREICGQQAKLAKEYGTTP